MTSLHNPKLITKFDSSDFPWEVGSAWPHIEKCMLHLDSSVDSDFCDAPRLSAHTDNNDVKSLSNHCEHEFNTIIGKK